MEYSFLNSNLNGTGLSLELIDNVLDIFDYLIEQSEFDRLLDV